MTNIPEEIRVLQESCPGQVFGSTLTSQEKTQNSCTFYWPYNKNHAKEIEFILSNMPQHCVQMTQN